MSWEIVVVYHFDKEKVKLFATHLYQEQLLMSWLVRWHPDDEEMDKLIKNFDRLKELHTTSPLEKICSS